MTASASSTEEAARSWDVTASICAFTASEAAGLAAETVTLGDPTFAGPLAGVSLGLTCYHVCEPEVKAEFDPDVYDEQISMMEMVLDVDDICSEMHAIRDQL